MGDLASAGDSTLPVLAPEDDFDLDADIDWLVREIDAGRQQVPPETAVEGPAVSLSLGDACDVDPALLAAVCGPDGLGGQSLSAAFGQDRTADVLRPGPVLAALTIDLTRAMTIAARTLVLTDADAACADEVLAAAAPGCRPDQLARKAAALEMKLAPDAVRARKELARQLGQRVEARREESGNASLAGRELDTADVIASAAYIDAIACQLRDSGLIDASLPRLRALALVDLTQGRDPLSRIKPAPGPTPTRHAPQRGEGPGRALHDTQDTTHDESANAPGKSRPGQSQPGESRPGQPSHDEPTGEGQPSESPVPLPALINVVVPAGTLLGWGTAPAHAAGWGLLDADETRTLLNAASRHPRSRWCMTITAPDGTAIAHGCAAGQRPWPPAGPPAETRPPAEPRPAGSPPQARELLDLLHRLNITLQPIARDNCAHTHAEDRYVPSRKLKHLLRARNQTCTAPACNAQASHCDIDHTVPYPDGPSCECNTNPKCRRHHRTKQAPGWEAAQPAPDTATWTTPAGRMHTTAATVYDL